MRALLLLQIMLLFSMQCLAKNSDSLIAANTQQGTHDRTIKVDMVVLEQTVRNSRLGAHLENAQIYALARDVVPLDHPMSHEGIDKNRRVDKSKLLPGKVRLATYKRPRPVVLRANVGDILEVTLTNLLPHSTPDDRKKVGMQVMGLDWDEKHNQNLVEPGNTFTFKFIARGEGVYMMFSPNNQSIPSSQLDYYLFGAVNVQPKEAEWYRSQVTHDDIVLATYKVNHKFNQSVVRSDDSKICKTTYGSALTGLPKGIELRRVLVREEQGLTCPKASDKTLWQFDVVTSINTKKTSEVYITDEGHLMTLTGQPLINYNAMYPSNHIRHGSPILNMLVKNTRTNTYQIAHSDLTAMITGPDAGRFPYYLDSPSFIENPASPDRRQPYREFTIAYHISPNTTQAFEAFTSGPLVETLAAGSDGFAVNYGIAGIAPEIYANRIGVGPMGINKDGVDLLFEEFFLSAWAVGDPAILVDIPANSGTANRATKALYPDDPSNVYHSYMRDHVKFRVLNTGSVAPHVHHQHAHQWLHTPNSADGHYLDSQMINPGSTYTMEMTYNGSGNRNQTVGDSIFHCHIYPHFAQGMWGMWRVHDVFEEGTPLNHKTGIPLVNSRALPDGEIALGTPIPGLVPLPTIAMAPIPAEVKLVDGGRRVEVTPRKNSDGELVYDNPGFPFFIPGVAGHRAPHPPMDFAWKEDSQGKQLLFTEKNAQARAFRSEGEPMYLDGGLPRHVVLGGEILSEFHTRWDFSKSVDKMFAMELPEAGTAVEKAAMAAHATRTHKSSIPDGLPGNFILNGLPPAPGAPFAAPEVDDNGNSTYNERRYKAAVIQTDVVFNKEGWHYPQQRFITLMEDVKKTVGGEKPPEPFFFRANTGETIDFWHTNLVPKEYELDDFQVRTPTDILGQHIHLVKFDVTASDGAGNGFNYEDGTFSPGEVRERIEAINKYGGLHHFDTTDQYISATQSRLEVASYTKDYGDVLGKPPAGQNWDGAQTTVQRFDTDPLLNHQGEDRTLRTVFTHDHFGPSTHQQVGLYGALLVEPSGSNWYDSITKQPLATRADGGPTSWQAIIETNDSVESYREFAIAMGDLQLAYTNKSKTKLEPTQSVWFYLQNSIDSSTKKLSDALNKNAIPLALSTAFATNGGILGSHAIVKTNVEGSSWTIIRNDYDQFNIELTNNKLAIYGSNQLKTWSSPNEAIYPPQIYAGTPSDAHPDIGGAPYPSIISDPGGSGNIGTWVTNYRTEPLDSRVQGPKHTHKKHANKKHGAHQHAEDPAFAYASIKRHNPKLNHQPKLGSPIGPYKKGFKYPKKALVPEGAHGVGPTDPYTPLLRAYANDNIEVRAIVGAVDSIHSFRIQGMNWDAEPSYPNSGRRDTQGMGISEHFEMLFTLPPNTAENKKPFVDYMYSASTSNMGKAKGTWGIMRAYTDNQKQLATLSNNSKPALRKNAQFYDEQDDVMTRKFDVNVVMNTHKTCLYYTPDSMQSGCEVQCSVSPSNTTPAPQLSCGHSPTDSCTTGSCVNIAQSPKQLKDCDHNANCSLNTIVKAPLILRAAAGDWIEVNLHNPLKTDEVNQLTALWGGNQSALTSSTRIKPYKTSAHVGLNPLLVSYDSARYSGLNIGKNKATTVAPGQTKQYRWYAGEITQQSDGEVNYQAMEFGGVNMIPADPLLQQSYGLYAALIIEPKNSHWSDAQRHSLSATIKDKSTQQALFTELVVLGTNTESISVVAGSEVRLRVLNPNVASTGQNTDGVNLITVEGHGWPEEPFTNGGTVIAQNPLTQWMGTQQVTPLESYNLVLPKAGGEKEQPGDYAFYYYPRGPLSALGTITVTP